MKQQKCFRIYAAFVAAVMNLGGVPHYAHAAIAEWTFNGSGSYWDTTKWTPGVVPCNVGGTTYSVVIPEAGDTASGGTVTGNIVSCNVDQLTLGTRYTLSIGASSNYTVFGQADISGLVQGLGGNFTAAVAIFPSNTARFSAQQGSSVAVGADSYSSASLDIFGNTTLFSASGSGSLLDLSSLSIEK